MLRSSFERLVRHSLLLNLLTLSNRHRLQSVERKLGNRLSNRLSSRDCSPRRSSGACPRGMSSISSFAEQENLLENVPKDCCFREQPSCFTLGVQTCKLDQSPGSVGSCSFVCLINEKCKPAFAVRYTHYAWRLNGCRFRSELCPKRSSSPPPG